VASAKPSSRDGDKETYLGKGVLKAVENVNGEIADALANFDAADQRTLDQKMIELDGTENKARLGANAILSVSMAAARAAANCFELPLYRYLGGAGANILPTPMMNILNGGAHADNNVDFRIHGDAGGCRVVLRSPALGRRSFSYVKGVLKKRGYNTAVGDEGSFAPSVKSNVKPSKLCLKPSRRPDTSRRRNRNCPRSRSQRVLSDSKYILRNPTNQQIVRRHGAFLGEVGERLSHCFARRRPR
jgi:enolase